MLSTLISCMLCAVFITFCKKSRLIIVALPILVLCFAFGETLQAQNNAPLFRATIRLSQAKIRKLHAHSNVGLNIPMPRGMLWTNLQFNQSLFAPDYLKTRAVGNSHFDSVVTDVRPFFGSIVDADSNAAGTRGTISLTLVTNNRFKGSKRIRRKEAQFKGIILSPSVSGDRFYGIEGSPPARSRSRLNARSISPVQLKLREIKASSIADALAQCASEPGDVNVHAIANSIEQQVREQRKPTLTLTGSGASPVKVRIAFDADYDYFSYFGRNSSTTIATIETILAAVDAMYRAQLSISFQLVYTNVWTIQSDPYTATNHADVLDEFSTFFENRNWLAEVGARPIYDIAHLMTGRFMPSGVVGVAWAGGVCTKLRYGVSQRHSTSLDYWAPILAHEVAHNLGAEHDDCSGGYSAVMCPSINQVRNFSEKSLTAINRLVSDPIKNCLESYDLPAGTVQSPHLTLYFDPLGSSVVNINIFPAMTGGKAVDFELFRSTASTQACNGTPLVPRLAGRRIYEDKSFEGNKTYYYSARSISSNGTVSACSPIASVLTTFNGTVPAFTSSPSSAAAIIGERVVFSGSASGNQIRYQWLRNGQPIAGATSVNYFIEAVTLADHNATFTLNASNPAGSVTSAPVKLYVLPTKQPLRITNAANNPQTLVGQDTYVSVDLEGSGPAKYRWKRNGKTVAEGVSEWPSLFFEIKAPTLAEHGQIIELEVDNSSPAPIRYEWILSVFLNDGKPVIVYQPEVYPVLAGETFSLGVSAVGDAPLRYQWKKNAQIIAETSESWRDIQTTFGDTAVYSVTVGNAKGSMTSKGVTLQIVDPSKQLAFIEHPRTQTVLAGSLVQFNALATGYSPLEYHWMVNGVPLSRNMTRNELSFIATPEFNGTVVQVEVSQTLGGHKKLLSLPATLHVTTQIDECPNDSNKLVAGLCGCGIADTDADKDKIPDCKDLCPIDYNKTKPGLCGCGQTDRDSDADGTPNCFDLCPMNPLLIKPADCGCENTCSAPSSPLAWKDYSFGFSMLSKDDDSIGVMFRYTDSQNYYRFSWDRERNSQRLVKVSQGVVTSLAERPAGYAMNVRYKIDIFLLGADISVSVDGAEVLKVKDSTHTQGTIAFYSYANAGSVFDDLQVKETLIGSIMFQEKFDSIGAMQKWQVTDQGKQTGESTYASSDWVVNNGQLEQRVNLYSQPIATGIQKRGTYLAYLGMVDLDRDSVDDAYELNLTTNPVQWDTDKDGLSDGEEVALWGVRTVDTDSDHDGLSNIRDFDSDQDGYGDGVEESFGGNPLNATVIPPAEVLQPWLYYSLRFELVQPTALPSLKVVFNYREAVPGQPQTASYCRLNWSTAPLSLRTFDCVANGISTVYAEDNIPLKMIKSVEVLVRPGKFHVFADGQFLYSVKTPTQLPGKIIISSAAGININDHVKNVLVYDYVNR